MATAPIVSVLITIALVRLARFLPSNLSGDSLAEDLRFLMSALMRRRWVTTSIGIWLARIRSVNLATSSSLPLLPRQGSVTMAWAVPRIVSAKSSAVLVVSISGAVMTVALSRPLAPRWKLMASLSPSKAIQLLKPRSRLSGKSFPCMTMYTKGIFLSFPPKISISGGISHSSTNSPFGAKRYQLDASFRRTIIGSKSSFDFTNFGGKMSSNIVLVPCTSRTIAGSLVSALENLPSSRNLPPHILAVDAASVFLLAEKLSGVCPRCHSHTVFCSFVPNWAGGNYQSYLSAHFCLNCGEAAVEETVVNLRERQVLHCYFCERAIRQIASPCAGQGSVAA